VVLAELSDVADLPRGVGDEQSPGRYRLRDRGDDALFGFAAPAQSGKSVLFPADALLWRARRDAAGGYTVDDPESEAPQPVALVGLRGCDLAAIGVHDTVLTGRPHVDAHYTARRTSAFLVAVTCGTPAGTCFCASMGTGPRPGPGADLTLTELADPHRFLVEAGSPAGESVLDELPTHPATDADHAAADALVRTAVAAMGRQLRTDNLPDLLYAAAESPVWADVATRCLACTNCTLVCPTCFCTDVADVSDLTGDVDERHRVWDSCFSQEYSRLHSGAVRTSTAARYRQWLTHKLGSWWDQFGTSGCVGCGRCITWCPVGIDLTAEVDALRDVAQAQARAGSASRAAPSDAAAPPRAPEEIP
jgi:ferredoxin